MSLPLSTKTPQVRASNVFGTSGTAPGSAPKRVLLIGSMITTALTTTMNLAAGGTEDVVTAAGTATLDRAVRATSADHAKTLTGQGSELHRGVITALEQYRGAEVYVAPVTYGTTPVKASAVLTPTVGTVAAGTIRVTICGYSVDVAVTASDTVSTIGLAIARAVNAQRDWPVTAVNVYATGVVTFTAKCAGPRGNALTLRAALLTSADTIEVLNGTAKAAFGVTITLSGGTADGGVYRFSGGAVDDDVTALLAAITSQKFDRICLAGYRVSGSASANHALLTAALDTLSESAQFDQQAVFGSVETYANSITCAQALNAPRGQWVTSPGSDDLPLSIAAAVAVGRLFGDSQLGGVIAGEVAEPACNLNGLELVLRAPRDPNDALDGTEVEACLNASVTPLAASPARPGKLALVSSICTRSLVSGTPSFAVYKTKDVTVADYARAFVVADLGSTYRGFNLVANSASGQPALAPRTTTPNSVEGRIYQLCKTMERRGILRDVDSLRAQIAATINASNPRRVDWTFPSVPPQDFDIADGTIYQQQPEA